MLNIERSLIAKEVALANQNHAHVVRLCCVAGNSIVAYYKIMLFR